MQQSLGRLDAISFPERQENNGCTGPNKEARDSAASRNSEVDMALSLAVSTGTSANDFLRDSNQLLPGGNADLEAIKRMETVQSVSHVAN